MNQAQPYLDMHQPPHISSGPSYSHSAPHYQPYAPQQPMPPTSTQYGPSSTYGYGPYPGSVTSPQSAGSHMPPNLQLPAMTQMSPSQYAHGPPNGAGGHPYPPNQQPFDQTGQVAPPGMKPRVTATLWEDEGSLCFQVEAKGVCVARREDNHFINGTKLLNVAGMTRGRRDGILKSEKVRHVVKIGPMHLKGVWIPFDRALEFANKEKITDQLYPLFVHNIGGLLYNPENSSRTNAVVAATEQRRRLDSNDSTRPPPPTSTTAPPLHHHHSMQASIGGQVPSTPQSMSNQAAGGRPGIDRAHTFPTPPTSASSTLAVSGMPSQGPAYGDYMQNGVSSGQPLSIDTGASNNARSMPNTPATTPPGQTVQAMPPYSGHQPYDNKQHYYATTPSSQTGYAMQNGVRFDHFKTDMGPPTAPSTANADSSQGDHKQEFSGHGPADSNEHHDNGYMNGNASYQSGRPEYANGAPFHHQLSPEMTSSPHQTGSGRGTPRTLPGSQPQWGGEYRTPPQSNQGSMYHPTGDSRGSNPPGSVDNYNSSAYSQSLKRRRDDDEQDQRPQSRDAYHSGYDQKRQKMGRPEAFGMPLPNMQAIKSGGSLQGR